MADDEENDPTAPFNELEPFSNFWEALTWKQIKKRVPICAKKTMYNRYFLANFVYLIYAIGILVIDFGLSYEEDIDYMLNDTFSELNDTITYPSDEGLEYPPLYRLYIALGVIHVISATLYWWAWRDHRWNDVIMIPEYLNHIEAALYLWSAVWYIREEEDPYGYYVTRIHLIETVAAFVELFASFGWVMSWYRTYTRTICRGFTLDDPDTVAYTFTTLSSFIYITYNIKILEHPESYYDWGDLYVTGDICYSVGAVFYLWANLRDDGWLWWMPVSGQYGIAAGRTQTGKPVKVGLPHLLIGGNEPLTKCFGKCFQGGSDGGKNEVTPFDENDNTK